MNNFDLLPLGLTNNTQGTFRDSILIDWRGLRANNWFIPNPIANLPNYKHIDCNGDGFIDSTDVAAIIQNYGQSYFRSSPPSVSGVTPLFVQSTTATTGDTIALDVHLGDANNNAIDVYGIAFTINYDSTLVKSGQTNMTISNSWLGSDLLFIQKEWHR